MAFPCNLCSKTYTRNENLIAHLHTHQGQQFPCQFCGKAFKRLDTRKRHEAGAHGPLAPVVCGGCQKGFSRMDTLLRHRRAHGGKCANALIHKRLLKASRGPAVREQQATQAHDAQSSTIPAGDGTAGKPIDIKPPLRTSNEHPTVGPDVPIVNDYEKAEAWLRNIYLWRMQSGDVLEKGVQLLDVTEDVLALLQHALIVSRKDDQQRQSASKYIYNPAFGNDAAHGSNAFNTTKAAQDPFMGGANASAADAFVPNLSPDLEPAPDDDALWEEDDEVDFGTNIGGDNAPFTNTETFDNPKTVDELGVFCGSTESPSLDTHNFSNDPANADIDEFYDSMVIEDQTLNPESSLDGPLEPNNGGNNLSSNDT